MTLYFISGLGADERVFQKLQLPQSWNSQHILWIDPLHCEPLSSYALRLSKGIDTTEDFILIGLSFGGIIAVEMSKFLQPKHTILISSIATRYELPLLAKLVAKAKLDRIIPASLLKIPYPLLYWFFGAKTSIEKQLVRQSITGTSSHFLKWAIDKIIRWKNEE